MTGMYNDDSDHRSTDNCSGKIRDISPIKWDVESDFEEHEKSLHQNQSFSPPKQHMSPPSNDTSRCSIFNNAAYFLIKSNNFVNIQLAMNKNVWSTPKHNEQRFMRAYSKYSNVILIFSVRESGHFQGFARICSNPRSDLEVNWRLPPFMKTSVIGDPFELTWISKAPLPFNSTSHLHNPWNDGKPVKIGRDGQEIEPKVGEELCKLFDLNVNESTIKPSMSSSDNFTTYYPDSKGRKNALDRLGAMKNRSSPKPLPADRRNMRNNSNYMPNQMARFNSGHLQNQQDAFSQVNAAAATMAAMAAMATVNGRVRSDQLFNIPPPVIPVNNSNNNGVRPLMSIPGLSGFPVSSINETSVPNRRHKSSRGRYSRSRSPSDSPLGRLEQLDYEEYLRQASRGVPVLPSRAPPLEEDAQYEERVEAFLRGIHRSRSRSKSRSWSDDRRGRRRRRSSSHDYETYRPKTRRR